MRSIIELIDALDVRKRILIIGSAFVDVIVHVPRLPLSGEDVEGSCIPTASSSPSAAAPTTPRMPLPNWALILTP